MSALMLQVDNDWAAASHIVCDGVGSVWQGLGQRPPHRHDDPPCYWRCMVRDAVVAAAAASTT